MTTYTPYPSVTFNGVAYADDTLSSISISMGRRDIMEQPQPGYASINLVTDADTPLAIELSQPVLIKIKDTAGVDQTIFGGTVSDIDISLSQYGSIGSIAQYSITAVGPLAQLNRRLAGGLNYAKEFDGTRIFNILHEVFLTSWEDLAPTLTWAELPATATWDSFDGVGQALVANLVTDIDQPGQYELELYNDGEANALSLVQIAAQSGRGVLYEGPSGELFYDDFISRSLETALSLTADDINSKGLRTAAQWSEIVNDASVTYRAGTETFSDGTSIFLYGQQSGSRATVLHNAADALQQAEDFVASRAYPRMYPETISLPLHTPTMGNATRNALIAAHVSTLITTGALPAVFGTTFQGYVEGVNWQLTRYTADLTLTLSTQTETYPSLNWFQIPVTTTWASYTPITDEWQDL